ncbi:MAG: SOS response-associated peptidase family protein [Propionivibrio sp.]|nr:SOS response-associated peptidase family protein [Propionivibrio sp.]
MRLPGFGSTGEKAGQVIESCTIIVGEPDEAVRQVHDRMPVILPRERQDQWLSPAVTDAEEVKKILRSAAPERLVIHRVGKGVGNAKNDDPEMIEKVHSD